MSSLSAGQQVLVFLGALTFTGLCIWLKKFVRLRAVTALIASIGFAYGVVGGLLTHLLTAGAHLAVGTAGKIETLTVGVAVPVIIIGALAFVYIHDLMPKHTAKMRTTIIGFLLPLLAVATGGAAGSLADNVHAGIVQAGPPAIVQTVSNPQHPGV